MGPVTPPRGHRTPGGRFYGPGPTLDAPRRSRDRGRERLAPVALDAACGRARPAPDEPGGCAPEANCHTFRATGITAYLLNGGTLERAQAIAAHESPRTTKLYDRTADEVALEGIEKIVI